MGKLFRIAPESEPPEPSPVKSVFVNNLPFSNAAAKFWPNLVEEISADFPSCSVVELSTLSASRLREDLLYPERALERDIQSLGNLSLDDIIKETMAEMELMGEPTRVRARLLEDEKELFQSELPPESVDAEVLLYLLVWLLNWAGIDPSRWDQDKLDGTMTAHDRSRGITYRLSFELSSDHVSEGLFRKTLRMEPMMLPSGGAGQKS